MSQIMLYIALFTCIGVLLVLIFGVGAFAKGGDFNRKYANKIMRLRILAQAIAVVMLLITAWLARNGF